MLILGIESSCDETAASVVKNGRCVLSGRKFEEEFDVYTFCDCKKTIEKMALYMQKHKDVFVNEDNSISRITSYEKHGEIG